jgi:thiosulfate reductase/polysulfide reductase chain A
VASEGRANRPAPTAQRLGIADGHEVVVESPHDTVSAVAELSRRIHPEVVGAQHGFGHRALGQIAKGRGTAFGDLNTLSYDPLAGQACHKEIRVRVRKA